MKRPLVLIVVVALALAAQGASADSIHHRLRRAKSEQVSATAALQRVQAALSRQERAVRTLLDRMQLRLSQAQQVAQAAGLKVGALQAQAQRIAAARARELRRETLLASGPAAASQAKLLALLGPNGGRGCA